MACRTLRYGYSACGVAVGYDIFIISRFSRKAAGKSDN